MKTKNSFLLAVGLLGLTATSLKAQIAINNSAANPNASAILDLQTGNAGVNKGFLPQSVALTNVTVAAPVVAPATGLLVYSSTAPTGGNGAGYYYWNGSAWASMNSNIYGSGINNYVARWTPNGTTLGTGLIQDNNVAVDVNIGYVPGAMLYSVASSGIASAGYTTDASSWGVGGYGQGGIGVYGAGSTYSVYGDATFYGAGSGGYFKDATGTNYATIADNTNANGVTAYGTNYGVYGTSTATNDAGVYGENDSWIGVEGYSTFAGGAGVAGYGNVVGGIGVFGDGGTYGSYSVGPIGSYSTDGAGDYAEAATGGNGLYASGADSGVSGYTSSGNSGVTGVSMAGNAVMGNGGYGGVVGYGQAYGTGGSDGLGDLAIIGVNEGFNIGGYFTDAGGDIAYVAYAGYGILSGGVKSTMVKDENNQNRVMYCNESPEVKFEDYGEGQLVNGKAHISLDPLLARNVTINQKHPLQAFVQLEGDCNGVYVTNKSVSGFDVVELNHGTSNTAFSWHIVANRAATVNKKGQTYDYANWRFPVGPDGSKISLVNPDKSAGKAVAKVAPKSIPAIADPKQSHKGTVVKQPVPIKNISGPKNNIGQPNTQK